MDQLQSPEKNKFLSFLVSLTGCMNSCHGLFALLAVLSILGISIALAFHVLPMAYTLLAAFSLLIIIFASRYAILGPEGERGRPHVSLTQQSIQVYNIDQNGMRELIDTWSNAIKYRKPLPKETQMLGNGSLAPEMVKKLTEQQ